MHIYQSYSVLNFACFITHCTLQQCTRSGLLKVFLITGKHLGYGTNNPPNDPYNDVTLAWSTLPCSPWMLAGAKLSISLLECTHLLGHPDGNKTQRQCYLLVCTQSSLSVAFSSSQLIYLGYLPHTQKSKIGNLPYLSLIDSHYFGSDIYIYLCVSCVIQPLEGSR